MTKYFQAREIDDAPFLVFDLVASNEKEAARRELSQKEYIFLESELPIYDQGVCLSQLNEFGSLEERDQIDIDAVHTKILIAKNKIKISDKFKELQAKELQIQTMSRMGEDTTNLESEFTIIKDERDRLISP